MSNVIIKIIFLNLIAVLVWLNYKNAYEYWNEQRASLNKEVSLLCDLKIIK